MDAPGRKSTSGVSHIRLSGVQGIAEKAEPEYHYSTLPADRLRGRIDDCRVESRAGHPGDQPLRRGMAPARRPRRLLPPGCAISRWTDLIFTHISARVPGPEHHFLINPYGLLFDEITASSLVKIDLDGHTVDRTRPTPSTRPAS